MSTVVGNIDIEIAPKLAAFRAGMSQIPGITDEYADKAAEAMRRSLWTKAAKEAAGLTNKIEREAAKAAAAQEREAKRAAAAMEREAKRSAVAQAREAKRVQREQEKAAAAAAAAPARSAAEQEKSWTAVGKKVAELAGGPYARLGQVVFDLIPNANKASATLGRVAVAAGAIGAAVVGVTAVATGLVKLANSAVAARDRLIEAGHAAEIPTQAIESLRAYEAATGELRTQWDLLVVTLGGDAAAVLTDVVTILSATLEVTRNLKSAVADNNVAWSIWEGLLNSSNPKVAIMVQSVQSLADVVRALKGDTDKLTASQIDYAQALAETDDEIRRKQAEAAKKLLEERKRDEHEFVQGKIRDAERAAEEEERLARQVAAERLKIQQEADQAIRDQLLEQNDAEMEIREEALELVREQQREWVRERVRLAQEAANRELEIEKQLADDVDRILQQRIEDQAASEATLRDQRAEFAQAAIDSAVDITSAVTSSFDTQTKAGRKAAMKMWQWQQRAALAQVEISTTLAVLKAFEVFGPPPSPAGIFAAGAAAAQGIASGVTVAMQQPPSFFSGGIVPGNRGDAVQATLHGGEPVLNTMAADNLGPDIIAALNAGLDPLKGMGGGTTVVQIDGRDVASRVMRRTKQRPAGFVSPYGRA
jgi:hypothetical protein